MSIRNRIHKSFFLLVSLFVINGMITIITLSRNKELSNNISDVIDPSLETMNEFKDMVIESKMYSTNWVFLRYCQEDKDALVKVHNSGFPVLKKRLNNLSKHWTNNVLIDSLNKVCVSFEQLQMDEKYIINSLKKFEDYDNPEKKLGAQEQLENIVLPKTLVLLRSLDYIISNKKAIRESEHNKLEQTSIRLRNLIIFLAVSIILLGMFLSVYFSRIIITPINKIRNIINDLGNGIIQKVHHKTSNDEIGEMLHSVNNLSVKLEETAVFAHEIGNRNFDTQFEPLSEKDTLGKALLAMRTNLREGEKELLRTHFQMQAFFKNIDEAFFSIDMTTNKLLQISDACEQIYGYHPSHFYQNPNFWTEVVLAEDKNIIDNQYQVMSAGKQFTDEYRILHKDNSIRWVETRITPSLDKNGKLIRIDGVTADITRRKEAGEILKKNTDELRKTYSELDKFVYSVSHDLRAPLSSMMGIVQITEEETQDTLILTNLGLIKESINKLDCFILDILDYSRNSRIEVMKEEIKFKEMLNDITSNLRFMNGNSRKVDIMIDIHEDKKFISDKIRISTVLNNLISNAIRYQNPAAKDPFVNVKIDMSDTETNIVVKDNGIGISKENIEKIFEMFYRVSEKSVGSGLGLYIVKETIDKLNGEIKVESEPGVGTMFQMKIPNLINQ